MWVKNCKINFMLRNGTFKLDYNAKHISYWPIIKSRFCLLISKSLHNLMTTYSGCTWMSEVLIAYFGLNKIGTYLAIKKTVWKWTLQGPWTFILSHIHWFFHSFISNGIFSVFTFVLRSGIIHSSFKPVHSSPVLGSRDTKWVRHSLGSWGTYTLGEARQRHREVK